MKPTDLCIPIYLNQQVVFDLLAVFDDGFSQLSTIRTAISESETTKRGVGASIGVSNVFALLGVSFSGERGKEQGTQGQTEISQERVHTPTSLFAKLRFRLQQQGLLRDVPPVASFKELSSGDFVEFKAVLRKNPLVDTIEGFTQLMQVAELFTSEPTASGGSTRPKGSKTRNQNAIIKQQMEGVLNALTQFKSVELIAELPDPKVSSVITARLDFFSEGSALDIVDGEFRVLGKVVRVAQAGESINLLRKTTFARFDQQVIGKLSKSFESIGELGLQFPKLRTTIDGPALQIIPIAIFA